MTELRKRILLVIDDATIGGGQQHVLSLASLLDHDTFETGVVCEAEGFLVDALRDYHIPHLAVGMSNLPDPRALWGCIRAIRKFRADLIHTHGGTAGVTGRLAAILCGVPCVHTYHGIHYLHDTSNLRRRMFTAVEKWLLPFTKTTICVAEGDLLKGERAGIVDRKRTVVIVNGIDTSVFPERVSYVLPSTPLLGTIGRLHTQKGHAVLLEALSILQNQGHVFGCRIVGDGELRGTLESMASSLKVSGAVEFVGSRTDTVVQLSGMDIFLLPSLWEGMPIVLAEAMASGLPIIASRVDGVQEVVRDEHEALLVPVGDPVPLARAIVRLLGDEALRRQLGMAARRRALESFDVRRMVRATESVYRSILP
jgi:glycosyltransferase involved in cell wall biosynthesis